MHKISTKRQLDAGPLPVGSLWRSGCLSVQERQALDDALPPSRSIASHTDLVRERGKPDGIFILVAGWACRYSITREGHRQISAIMVPGDICNPEALLFDRSDCGIRTLTASTVTTLPRAPALALSSQHSGIAQAIAGYAFVQNAMLGKLTLSLGRRIAKARLAHLICELSLRLEAHGYDGSNFKFPLTQELIGDALGMTAVHMNRTMQILRREGLIGTSGGYLTLHDMPRLRQIAEFDPQYLHIEPSVSTSTRAAYPNPRRIDLYPHAGSVRRNAPAGNAGGVGTPDAPPSQTSQPVPLL